MAIVVTRKQLTLEKLTESLVTSRATKAQVASAVEAIRRANPGLATGRLPTGTPLVVPPLPHERVDISAVAHRVDDDLSGPDGAAAQLEPFAAANRDQVAARVEELTAALGDLSGSRGSPVDKAAVADARKLLEEDLRRAEALASAWSDAVPGWQAAVRDLQALVTRGRT